MTANKRNEVLITLRAGAYLFEAKFLRQNFPNPEFLSHFDVDGNIAILRKISIRIPNGHTNEQYALPAMRAKTENVIKAQQETIPNPANSFKRDGKNWDPVGLYMKYVLGRA